jgi:hypothetical protein
MIVKEKRILEWDEEKKGIKIRKDTIREIIEQKLTEFRAWDREELKRNLKTPIFNDDKIEILVEVIEMWIEKRLEFYFNINNGWKMLSFKEIRGFLIEELNSIILRKIDKIFEGIKLIEKMAEEINNLLN